MLALASCSQEKAITPEILDLPQTGTYSFEDFQNEGVDCRRLTSGEIGRYGGSVAQALPLAPKTFNPWAATDLYSHVAASPMYYGLVGRHPWTGEIIPTLAKSYELQEGGRRIIIHLRKGLKWSDGKSLTAADVLFTWNFLLKNNFDRLGVKDIVTVNGKFPQISAPNPHTVIFETDKVYAPLLGQLGYEIAPKHFFWKYLQKAEGDGKDSEAVLDEQRRIFSTLLGTGADPKSFVVSGPFKLKHYQTGEFIKYQPNPHFWTFDAQGNRLPYLKEFIYEIVGNGDLNLYKFSQGELLDLDLSPESLALLLKIKVKPEYQIYKLGPTKSTYFFMLNLSRRGQVPAPQRDWFNDLRFRQALAAAINRKAIIDSLYEGVGQPLCFNENPKSIYFDESLRDRCPSLPDLKKARRLLQEAGFELRGRQLYDPQGNPVIFNMFYPGGDSFRERELMAVLLKEQWQELGIKLNTKGLEFNNLIARFGETGDWQAGIAGLSGGDLFEPNTSKHVWTSDGRLHMFDQRPSGKPVTDARPWELEIDQAFTQGTEFIEFEKRKPFYTKVQQIIWEQKPLIYLAAPETLYAIQKDTFGNIIPSKLSGIEYNLEQWFKR
ncbi:MAG: ABC transporter substrate-binding protein [Candidatus Caenarcaniphilales bacterium]|nr:ABC transporter substrate-binding protein [Candidatus Caenarcaniphilales bacterium]